jgi:hypothetical protein
MRFLFKLLLLFIVLTPIAAIVAVGLSIEDQPLVASTSELPPNAIRRARTIVRAHDPRRLPEGAVRTVRLGQRDLELAINYLARESGAGGAKVSIDKGALGLQVTALLPIKGDSGKRYYINLDLQLDEQPNGVPKVAALRLGKMKIPSTIADFALDYWLRHGPGATPERPLSALVRAVKMRPRQLAITYQWQPELLSDLRASVLSEPDRRRLRDYHEQMVESVAKLPRNVSVARLLQPMFKFAKSRSAGGDAIAENRAAIIVLSTFGAGRSLGSVMPEAKSWPRPPKLRLTLRGRRDFAQHFLTSAGLVVLGGNRFSDVVGLAKEVDDAGFGSGFSFPDITADRAGTRFAETALHSQASAKQLQQRLAAGVKDAALMPSVRGMPEFMDKAEFARRFERIGSSAYNKMMATIEQRLDAVRLYQDSRG